MLGAAAVFTGNTFLVVTSAKQSDNNNHYVYKHM